MDINALMKQAQSMQNKLNKAQEELKDLEAKGTSGGGLVTATLTGDGKAKNVNIDKSLIEDDDLEMLQDLIVAAFNSAKENVESESAKKMEEITGGMQLPPGMKMPF